MVLPQFIQKFSKGLVIGGLLLTVGTCEAVFAQEPANTATPDVVNINRQDLIKYRTMVMEIKGRHTQAIKYLVGKKMNLRFQVMAHAKALNWLADDLMRLFLKNSVGPESRAKAEIWDGDGKLSKGFVDQVKSMKREAQALERVASIGSMDAVKTQLRQFEKNGCDSCHNQYRNAL